MKTISGVTPTMITMMTMTAVQSASPLSLNRSEISVKIHQTASTSNHVNKTFPRGTPPHPISNLQGVPVMKQPPWVPVIKQPPGGTGHKATSMGTGHEATSMGTGHEATSMGTGHEATSVGTGHEAWHVLPTARNPRSIQLHFPLLLFDHR